VSIRYSADTLLLCVASVRREFEVRSLSSNVHVTSVQFTRPFAYSSSSWVEDDQDCDKDVTRFSPADVDATTASNWSSTTTEREPEERDVIVTIRSRRAPYQYAIKSANDPPHMKLTIPGT